MQTVPSLRVTRERFTHDLSQALARVPSEIAGSAIGHAVIAEALVSAAARILHQHGNGDFLNKLVEAAIRMDRVCLAAKKVR